MSKSVVRSSLTEQVYMLIINKIQNNILSQGDRINIEELTREFNVSRTPVREAINRLIRDGFVEQVHNVGPRIITLSKKQILDLIYTNSVLFTGVLESLVNSKHKSEIVSELSNILDKQKKCVDEKEFDQYFFYAIEFHNVFINYCENQKLREFTKQTQTQLDMFVLYYLKDKINQDMSIEDHTQLLKYFENDDYNGLISLMKKHNLSAQTYFNNFDIVDLGK